MLRNTLDGIEALAALAQSGTVSEAATRLRLTQSAVTKRLQALQRFVESPLIEHAGRRVQLTEEAYVLLERARPLLADLRALTVRSAPRSAATFSLAIADSIAGSWGPSVLSRALSTLDDVQVDLHVHRSVLLIENVRLGRYHIGLASDVPTQKDLIHYPVIAEPMVLLRSPERPRAAADRPLITIEPTSMTWRAIEPLLQAHHPELLARRRLPVETFSAAVQMVKVGFGDGLVPLGLARDMKVPSKAMRVLRHVERHVTLLTRKTVNQAESFTRLRDALQDAARRHFAAKT
jgi:DNA-binding transcriptional LysR family regulator